MSPTEIDALRRAHQMFTGGGRQPVVDAAAAPYEMRLRGAVALTVAAPQRRYQLRTQRSYDALLAAARTDTAVTAVVADAHRDRDGARELTGTVLAAARADAATAPVTPMAQREALRRRAARLRAQHAHVLSARGRARRHLAALRLLRYRIAHHGGAALRLPSRSGRAGIAVRAALSRLGCPYVWGASGPSQFDCSGLVQWAYAHAGVHLDRTTYQQINDGIPVPRPQVRPGDLVFPHPGHVQLAIGNNLVVEAPYSGASVRISPLGNTVAIRRPW